MRLFLVNAKMIVTVRKSSSTSTWSAIWLLVKNPEMMTMVVGCVYHPPSDNDTENLMMIEDTLNKLSIDHPNAKILLCGDFNQLPLDGLSAQFSLSKMVLFFDMWELTSQSNSDGYRQLHTSRRLTTPSW